MCASELLMCRFWEEPRWVHMPMRPVHKVWMATGGQSYLDGAAIVDIVLTCSMSVRHHE